MKKFLFLLMVLFCVSCTKDEPVQEPNLYEFCGTRVDAPLENTIWGHETGGDYNLYILFEKGRANAFYGLIDGELQRWSPFYSAPYWYDGCILRTNIVYPYFGEQVATQSLSVIRAGKGFEIDVDGKTFNFVTTNTETVRGMWVEIRVTINPWE